MSTSAAEPTATNAPPEPLASLLEAIEEARTLPEPAAYRRTWDDPLEEIRRRMRGEETGEQAQRADQRTPRRSEDSATLPERATRPSPADDAAGVVGRRVLELLEQRPLEGPARARAVALLAEQIDHPDPDQLREILGLLVEGRAD